LTLNYGTGTISNSHRPITASFTRQVELNGGTQVSSLLSLERIGHLLKYLGSVHCSVLPPGAEFNVLSVYLDSLQVSKRDSKTLGP
jgi:hypothetical protein